MLGPITGHLQQDGRGPSPLMILVYNWKPPQRSPSIMKKITLKQSNHKVLALSAVFPSQRVSTVGCIVVTSQQGHTAS